MNMYVKGKSYVIHEPMKGKLTLSIDKRTIEKSKKLAQLKRTSLSQIVEEILDASVSEMDGWKPEKGSITEQLTGCIRIETEEGYKKIIEDARSVKYENEEGIDCKTSHG